MFIGTWVADWWTPRGYDVPAAAQYINHTLFLLLICLGVGYLIFCLFGKRTRVSRYNKVFGLRRPWFGGLLTFLGLLLIVCYSLGLSIPCKEGKLLNLIGAIFELFVLEGIIGTIIYALVTRLKAPAKVKYTSIFVKG
jgi:hypothetical protein